MYDRVTIEDIRIGDMVFTGMPAQVVTVTAIGEDRITVRNGLAEWDVKPMFGTYDRLKNGRR